MSRIRLLSLVLALLALPFMALAQDDTSGEITGITWEWVAFRSASGLDDININHPDRYTLTLEEDGNVGVQFDCNSGGGSYTLDGSSLDIGPLITTLMACPPGSLASEFGGWLENVVTFVQPDENTLVLNLAMDSGDLVFRRAGTGMPAETLGTWEWIDFISPTGEDGPEIADPSSYTLTFFADGRVAAQIDCNSGAGMITAEGASLRFGPMAVTEAFCGEDSLDTFFNQRLTEVATYFLTEEGNLILNLMADGGDMIFRPSANELVGSTWGWIEYQDTAGMNDIVVGNPTRYTITFNADGSYSLRADCNRGMGSYTAAESSLSMSGAALTRAFCGDDSLDTTFTQRLTEVATYVFDDEGRLVMNLMMDAGNMVFIPLS